MSAVDAWYLVVNGRLWLRHSSLPRAVWFADFDAAPTARRSPYDGPLPFGDHLVGECEDAQWDLTLQDGGALFPYFSGVLRRVASTNVDVERPAVRVDGWYEAGGVRHELDGAAGQVAHVRVRQHAQRWGWFHAALPDGGWLDGLVAKRPRLPQVAFHVRDGRREWSRGTAAPGLMRVGPFTVAAPRESFVGVTYEGAYCWHSEHGRLTGGGLEVSGVAFEYGSHAKVDGWPVSI